MHLQSCFSAVTIVQVTVTLTICWMLFSSNSLPSSNLGLIGWLRWAVPDYSYLVPLLSTTCLMITGGDPSSCHHIGTVASWKTQSIEYVSFSFKSMRCSHSCPIGQNLFTCTYLAAREAGTHSLKLGWPVASVKLECSISYFVEINLHNLLTMGSLFVPLCIMALVIKSVAGTSWCMGCIA